MKRQASEGPCNGSKRAKLSDESSSHPQPGPRKFLSDIIQNPDDEAGYIACSVFMMWEPMPSCVRMMVDVREAEGDKQNLVKVTFKGQCFESLRRLGVHFDVQDEMLLALRGFSFGTESEQTDGLSWSGVVLTYASGTLVKFTKRRRHDLSDATRIVDTRRIVSEDEELLRSAEEPVSRHTSPIKQEPASEPTLIESKTAADVVPTTTPPATAPPATALPPAAASITSSQTTAPSTNTPSTTGEERPKTRKQRHKDRKKDYKAEKAARRQRSEPESISSDPVTLVTAKSIAPLASTAPRNEPRPIPTPGSRSKTATARPLSTASVNANARPRAPGDATSSKNLKPVLAPPSSQPNQASASRNNVAAQAKPNNPALNLATGGDFAGRRYTPLGEIQHGQVYTVAGVVSSFGETKRTKTGDMLRCFRIIDPSSYAANDTEFRLGANELSVNCFMNDENRLPVAQPGDVLVFSGVKGDSFNDRTSMTGPANSTWWAAYCSSSPQGFRHNVGSNSGVFPFYEPQPAEVDYCRQLFEWQKAIKERSATGTVYQITEDQVGQRLSNARPHLQLGDVNVNLRKFFDCTVEVLYCGPSFGGQYHQLYVTDYTKNENFRAESWEPRGLPRSVLAIELSHEANEEGSGIAPGYYDLENVRTKVSGLDGYYEGNMQEKKLRKLEIENASYNGHLKSLLERKATWAKEYAPDKLAECFLPSEKIETRNAAPSVPSSIATSSYHPSTSRSTIKEIKTAAECPKEFRLSSVKITDRHPHSLQDAVHRFCASCDLDILGLQKVCSKCKTARSVRFVYEIDLRLEDRQGESICIHIGDKYKLKDGEDTPFLQGLKRVSLKEDKETLQRFESLFDNLVKNCARRDMVILSVPDATWEDGRAYHLWDVN